MQADAETEGSGKYTYHIEVTHVGTGTNTLVGDYLIYHYCYATQKANEDDDWVFYVPDFGNTITYSFPYTYLDYIDEHLIGCDYGFTLVWRDEYTVDGEAETETLTVDYDSGVFSYVSHPYEKHAYEHIDLVVRNLGSRSTKSTAWTLNSDDAETQYVASTDQYNLNAAYATYTEIEVYHTSLHLVARCGPLSSTVAAALDGGNDYTSSPNYTPEDLSGSYTVTNEACDVVDGRLTVGDEMWDLVNWDPVQRTFDVRVVNNPQSPGAYDFTVVLTAEGGASGSASNTM